MQVLVVVLLTAALGGLMWVLAVEAIRSAGVAEEALRVRLRLVRAIEDELVRPPDIALLCLASPLAGSRATWTDSDGGALEIRWRHLGGGIILAEADVHGGRGGRDRVMAWLAPDSVKWTDGGVRCGGETLHPLGAGAIVTRPGE